MALHELRHRLRHPVLVQDGHGGNVEAHHRPGLARVAAGGDHHVLADDVAAIRAHPPLAARLRLEGGDARFLVDLRALGARAGGCGLGHVGGCDVAVVGVVDPAEEVAVALEKGPQRAHLRRGEDLGAHPLRLGDARVVEVLVHALAGVGDAQLPALVPADGVAGLRLESLVDLDGLGDEAAEAVAEAVDGDEAGRVATWSPR